MRAFLFGLSPSSSSYVFLKGYFAVTYSVALAPLPSPRARVCLCPRAVWVAFKTRYLISARWYNTWRSFADGLSQEPPGPIDNSALFGASASCVHLQFVVGCF